MTNLNEDQHKVQMDDMRSFDEQIILKSHEVVLLGLLINLLFLWVIGPNLFRTN
jgi:hypothetical protein